MIKEKNNVENYVSLLSDSPLKRADEFKSLCGDELIIHISGS